ncbi:Hypothetical predicted protein [Olea europaea subsp. europaea]|uniref:GPI-anchored protein LLG1-like domain-containing protein n=1 Tax=Olea europaea subsp. europaea TaxID=158383 RepID=A0A8S0RVT8_OLEEU|nr:Hypothetical predicted protein [Olea europaea subsp. europaea]
MGWSQIKSCLILVVFLFLFTGLSASTFISDDIFGCPDSTNRRLLQAKKASAKGHYTFPNLRCGAFKEFACPFYDELNDCASVMFSYINLYVMFSYINLYGKYPAGLFASECRESKDGLECSATPPSSSLSEKTEKASAGKIICHLFSMLMLSTASLLLSL